MHVGKVRVNIGYHDFPNPKQSSSLVGENVVTGMQAERLLLVGPVVIVHHDEAPLRFYKAADYQINDLFPLVKGRRARAVLLNVVRCQKP